MSIEFLTKKPDGTLLYNGPMIAPEAEEGAFTDFISLELESGNPRLLIDFGSGTLELKIKPPRRLDDGDWHRIDLFWDTENVRMVLDLCRHAPVHEPEDGSAVNFNTSSCEVKGVIPPFNEYLDVNSPLQIGGMSHASLDPAQFRWDHLPHGKGFNGCIRNVVHNSKIYDLAEPGMFQNSQPGCAPLDELCAGNEISGPGVIYLGRPSWSGCGEHGTCTGSLSEPRCECRPGWTGPACNQETVPATFNPQSYVKYALSFEPDRFLTSIQLRFRTREEHGELFRVSDQHAREYGILEVIFQKNFSDQKFICKFYSNFADQRRPAALPLQFEQPADG